MFLVSTWQVGDTFVVSPGVVSDIWMGEVGHAMDHGMVTIPWYGIVRQYGIGQCGMVWYSEAIRYRAVWYGKAV